MHLDCGADDNHNCAMHLDSVAYVNHSLQCTVNELLMISIVVHCIGIKLLISIVVQCIGFKLLM